MDISPAASSSCPWPAPADRRCLGKRTGFRPKKSATTGRGRLAGLVDVPPIPAPLRRLSNGPPTIISPIAAVLRMAVDLGGAGRAAADDRISPDRRRPSPPYPAARAGLARIEGRQGTVRELGGHAEVSEAVMRGLVNAGALNGSKSTPTSPFPEPDPEFAPPALNDEQQAAAASRRGDRPGLRSGPARRRHRLRQDRSLFRSDRRRARQGKQVLVLLPEIALTEPFLTRFTARFGCEPVTGTRPPLLAAAPRMARDRQRRGASWSGRARRCSCPTPTSA